MSRLGSIARESMLLESPANDVEGEADGGGDRGSFMVDQGYP